VVADVHDELAFHLEMRTIELVAQGKSPDVARAEAIRRFGDLADATSYCRRTGERREKRTMRTEWIAGLRQDIGFALRTLTRAPGFTAVAVLTLALGIGANTAIFSVVRGILLRPFPFPHPDQIVMVAGVMRGRDEPLSPADGYDWIAQNRSFSGMSLMDRDGSVLTDHGQPQMLSGVRVSPGFFTLLGVKPLVGRLAFTEQEGAWQGDRAVVLSETLWRTQFGSDPKLVGTAITLDHQRYQVVGIAPAAGSWPESAAFWTTFTYNPAELADSRGGVYLQAIARLKPGVSLAAADADMKAIEGRLAKQFPEADDGLGAHVVPLRTWVTGSLRTPLLVLLGGVGFVLLIACANVANLLLVRGVSRSSELAVRTALGAGRGRLVRQLVTESLVLALAGGIVAIMLAVIAAKLLVQLAPANIPRLGDIHVDGVVLASTLGVSVLIGLVFGLIPARQVVRPDLAKVLREGGRGAGGRAGSNLARRGLIVAEVALSVMLLAGAGLLINSFRKLMNVDPGFRTEHSIHYGLSLPTAKYPTKLVQGAFVRSLVERMNSVKGVESAGVSFGMPLTTFGFALTFDVRGRPTSKRPGDQPVAQIRMATPNYLSTMGIPVIRGRGIVAGDRQGAPRVMLITEAAVRRFFPNEDPIGKHLNFGMTDGADTLQGDIVGVVRDVKHSSLANPADPQVWVPFAQWPMQSFNVVLHTRGDPQLVMGEVRRAVHELDPDLALSQVKTLDKFIDDSVAQPRFYMTLLAAFAFVALALSAIGIYGVIAYLVSQRSREIGIRIALGATSGGVVRMIVREGAAMVGAGLAIGLVGALVLTRLMSALLFNTSSSDPTTYGVVIVTLAGVALLASSVPALRAARVDPALAMRAD
jgi:putative ABC transport system permease protein